MKKSIFLSLRIISFFLLSTLPIGPVFSQPNLEYENPIPLPHTPLHFLTIPKGRYFLRDFPVKKEIGLPLNTKMGVNSFVKGKDYVAEVKYTRIAPGDPPYHYVIKDAHIGPNGNPQPIGRFSFPPKSKPTRHPQQSH